MTKPTLVIMAAGMGSRYGGLKQIDPIDPQGHIIMDYLSEPLPGYHIHEARLPWTLPQCSHLYLQ